MQPVRHFLQRTTSGLSAEYCYLFVIWDRLPGAGFRGRLSVLLSSVFFMEGTGFADIEEATGILESLLSGVADIRDGQFWKLGEDHLLDVARNLERISRITYAAQIRLVGEIDTQGLAARRSCSSTGSLLRQLLNISPGDACNRVKAAKATMPQELPSGGETPAVLPILGEALDAGELGSEHTREIVATMKRLPNKLDPDTIAAAEQTLVETGKICDPKQLAAVGKYLETVLDPDGKLDDRDPAAKCELSFGTRNAATGMTSVNGRLDDEGVAVVRKAIDALSAPRPEVDGVKDSRSAATRAAQGLVEAMRRYLDFGAGPTQGGEKPHLTIVMQWDALKARVTSGMFDTGMPLTPSQLGRYLCDAKVIPAILGTDGEILNVGRTSRTFPTAIRRAITLRDKGCVWPGCDRPPSWCDAHHIAWWTRDFGETSLENGCLLCSFHHSEIHKGEWELRLGTHRRPEFIPPKWIDPTQKPRRNTLFDIHPPEP